MTFPFYFSQNFILLNQDLSLSTPIEYLKGVGPQRGELLRKQLNVHSIGDLLTHFPFRYVDKTVFSSISQLVPNEYAQILVSVVNIEERGMGRSKRLIAIVDDGTSKMEILWFKIHRWLSESLVRGSKWIMYGKCEFNGFRWQMIHPDMEVYQAQSTSTLSKFEPVYSNGEILASKGLNSKGILKLITPVIPLLNEKNIPESLPNYLLEKLGLIPSWQAFRQIHLPKSIKELEDAQARLKFEELFYIRLKIIFAKAQRAQLNKGFIFSKSGDFFQNYFHHHLPFALTGAQKRVIKEIHGDMMSGKQMNRLLQGDVGSGKTMVAFLCMIIAVGNGFQACLMAPTEVLAAQHATAIGNYADSIGLNCCLLTSNIKGKERNAILKDLAEGKLHLIVGTHALLEDWVVFNNLGLCVIDEQHRFGVGQRAKLWEKTKPHPPHILVMTATPIPRTLAMTLYGDLDISIIDELPPGRKEIKTLHFKDVHRGKMFEFVRQQIELGRQIYIVYPLIEESEKLDLENLNTGYEKLLQYFPLPQYRISIVHGKMKPTDKHTEMQRFVTGSSHIMVATTVIEVGVNVPNASVMIIENAERFGLSQLHQLRGRVGRGADQSYCILMTSDKLSKDSVARIKTMCDTNDGFKIAEADLELRGPGDLEGTKQSGLIELKVANIFEDSKIFQAANAWAEKILEKDPNLENPLNSVLKQQLIKLEKIKFWSRIS
ncbi:MAG TPA: ATP-dependent DNA helicase RecG [Saprospiraceae bacterium]|nr:ATP-dependent DNA helicase RecG [Saprospiraceae bacterium]